MNRRGRFGFTLIELLVTIGIIAVLIGILVPVVQHVQASSRYAATQALMQKISAGINNYHNTFRDYPGIFPNSCFPGLVPAAAIDGSTVTVNLTQTEDMTVCLLGGYMIQSGRLTYSLNYLGTGPINFNPISPSKGTPYLERRNEEFVSDLTRSFCVQKGLTPSYPDTAIPEFLDAFPDDERRPILYLRANPNGKGTKFVDSIYKADYHYNLAAIKMYMNPDVAKDPLGDLTKAQEYFRGPTGTSAKYAGSYMLIGAGQDRQFGTLDDIIFGGGGGQ